jgi:GTP-binding protein
MVNLKATENAAERALKALGRAEFTVAAHALRQLPPDLGVEVACAGRSNAGKSSALNAISARRDLARVSKTPGRTQQLVVFELDPERRLVDLPGYGYAAVPGALRMHWGETLTRYFETREALRGLLLSVDIRRGLGEHDRSMLSFSASRALPAHVLLTKADKLGRGAAGVALKELRKELENEFPQATAQLFSATAKTGVEEARTVLAQWLEL